jgi:hypothetical protein
VYAESAAGPYQGRLNSGLYDAYLDVRLQAGRPPGLVQALFVPPAFPGGESPYLFGGQFVDYLARAYGQEAVTRFLQESAGSALSYHGPATAAGWTAPLRCWYHRGIVGEWVADAGEAAAGVRRGRRYAGFHPAPASQTAWWMGTPVPQDGRVYFLRSLPYPAGPFRESWRHELRELGPGGERTVARFASPFSADLKWREGRLYFGLHELERGLANVELLGIGAGSVLYALDPATGRRERVLRAPLRAYEVLTGGDVVFTRDRTEGFGSEILLWKSRPAEGEENPRCRGLRSWSGKFGREGSCSCRPAGTARLRGVSGSARLPPVPVLPALRRRQPGLHRRGAPSSPTTAAGPSTFLEPG